MEYKEVELRKNGIEYRNRGSIKIGNYEQWKNKQSRKLN